MFSVPGAVLLQKDPDTRKENITADAGKEDEHKINFKIFPPF